MMLANLSDEELLSNLAAISLATRRLLGRLLLHLIEVEERRLDLRSACSSLYDFCQRRLGMSESEAVRRIQAARLVKRFPALLAHVERGDIHLTGLYLLRDHFTADNVDELVRATRGKTRREVEELLAARAPRPDVFATITELGTHPAQGAAAGTPSKNNMDTAGDSGDARGALSGPCSAPPRPSPAQVAACARIEPLAATRYRLELTIGSECRAKMDRALNLASHRVPDRSLEVVVGWAFDALLEKLERERLGKLKRRSGGRAEANVADPDPEPAQPPRPASDVPGEHQAHPAEDPRTEFSRDEQAVSPHREKEESEALRAEQGGETTPEHESAALGTQECEAWVNPRIPAHRYIPRGTVRAVFARDGERCTFTDEHGNRCGSGDRPEVDHIIPRAHGGPDTLWNLRVVCRAHNRLYAEQVFGREHVERLIHLRQRRSQDARRRRAEQGSRSLSLAAGPAAATPDLPGSFDIARRALTKLGFRDADARLAVWRALQEFEGVAAPPIAELLKSALTILTP